MRFDFSRLQRLFSSPGLVRAVGAFLVVILIGWTAMHLQPNAPTILEKNENKSAQVCTQSRQDNGEKGSEQTGVVDGIYTWTCDPQDSPDYQYNKSKYPARSSTDADLLAQERVAYWTRVIAGLTALGIGILGWTLFETRAVAGITREIGEAQVRAYLSCTGGEFCNDGYTLVIRPEFKNTGQSPAKSVIVHLTLDQIATEEPDIADDLYKQWFEDTSIRRMQIDDVVPSESERGCFEFEIRKAYQKGTGDIVWAPLYGNIVTFVVTGWVEWTDVFGIKSTQTFWLRMQQSEDAERGSFCGTLERGE